eukprot:COSAG06_NODE_355_length_16870_cov_21.389064_10_plen_155_part_00
MSSQLDATTAKGRVEVRTRSTKIPAGAASGRARQLASSTRRERCQQLRLCRPASARGHGAHAPAYLPDHDQSMLLLSARYYPVRLGAPRRRANRIRVLPRAPRSRSRTRSTCARTRSCGGWWTSSWRRRCSSSRRTSRPLRASFSRSRSTRRTT